MEAPAGKVRPDETTKINREQPPGLRPPDARRGAGEIGSYGRLEITALNAYVAT